MNEKLINDLSHFTTEELNQLETVLQRNDMLSAQEALRIRRLRSGQTPIQSPTQRYKSLQHCQCGISKMVWTIAGAAALCTNCQEPLCRACLRIRICSKCRQTILFEAKAGVWFHRQLSTRHLDELNYNQSSGAINSRNHNNRQHNIIRRHVSLSGAYQMYSGVQQQHHSEPPQPMELDHQFNNQNYNNSSNIESNAMSGHQQRILQRLKTYNSIQSELDCFDETLLPRYKSSTIDFNNPALQSDYEYGAGKCQDRGGSNNQQHHHYKSINNEFESPSSLSGSPQHSSLSNCFSPQDNLTRQMTRPISYVNSQPLKSANNGSPLPSGDRCSPPSANHSMVSRITPSVAPLSVNSLTRNHNNGEAGKYQSSSSIRHASSSALSLNSNLAPQPVPSLQQPEILVELDYDYRQSQLIVVLRQCRNLPPGDPNNNNLLCPYLFLLLLPDRSRKSRRTTSVKKNSFHPVYDQIFKYPLNPTEVESRSLLIMLCHKDDTSSRDIPLAQLIIPLTFLDFSQPITKWYSMQIVSPQSNSSPLGPLNNQHSIPPYHGEMNLAIKFSSDPTCAEDQPPTSGELHVWVKSMRNITRATASAATNTHQAATNTSTLCASTTSARKWSTVSSPASTSGSYNSPTHVASTNQQSPNISALANPLAALATSRLLNNAVSSFGQAEPVVRICLLPYRGGAQSTPPAKPGESPSSYVWSAILKFPGVDLRELSTRSLEITVWLLPRREWLARLAPPRCLGGVRLHQHLPSPCRSNPTNINSCNSTSIPEQRMWTALLDRPNIWIDGTLPLRNHPSFTNISFPSDN